MFTPAQAPSPLQTPRFGLETEFMLVHAESFQPLWYQDLDFFHLEHALSTIQTSDIPGDHSPLALDPPHTFNSPYVIEGYHIPGGETSAPTILPKGLEIRTPVFDTIEGVMSAHRTLMRRLFAALLPQKLRLVALSHHPKFDTFDGPQHERTDQFWQWAKKAMCTYGPDFNISLPLGWLNLPPEDCKRKLQYYGPAMAALSANSPFLSGAPWYPHPAHPGKSLRMARRSQFAPCAIFHDHGLGRIEFKDFEMTPASRDLTAYFYLVLGVLLARDLKGRATFDERTRELALIAGHGLDVDSIRYKADTMLKGAERALLSYGFSPKALTPLHERLEKRVTPADNLLSIYAESESLSDTMRYLASQVEEEL